MWYLFDKNNICFGESNQEVNTEDLQTRNEYAVESEVHYADFSILRYIDGKIVAEEPEPLLDNLKAAKLAEINTWTQQAITGGFVSTCTGAPVKYDSDVDTQITMQGIALNATSERFAAEYPQGCPCRGYEEGSDVKSVYMLTGEQVLGFCADLSLHIGVCKQRGWQLQAAVDAAKTTEELERITWAE